MTQFKTKWLWRHYSLNMLSWLMSFTFLALVFVFLKLVKFFSYAKHLFAKKYFESPESIDALYNAYWAMEVKPVLLLVPVFLIVDVLLRLYVIKT